MLIPLGGVGASYAEHHQPYAIAYFGEPVGGLSEEEQAAFYRGFSLFVSRFDAGQKFAHNAGSCVSCHSVPMPGGSGMADRAEVSVRTVVNRTEVLQRMQSGSGSDQAPAHEGEVRRTPPLFGLGFIEYAQERTEKDFKQPIFGAFAEHSSLREFVSQAFATELGVSSGSACARERVDAPYPSQCSADISEGDIDDVVSFLRFLAAPPHRVASNEAGRHIFDLIGCSGCHVESIHTLLSAPNGLRGEIVSAYSDLKKHAIGYERAVRTSPLWGLNSVGPPYLHTAKANNIQEAILSHSGEASLSADRFRHLNAADKQNLIEFLKSL